ncbi:hypothetical protein RN001_013864 [Aquatica leii]|uniref:AAA+ ATPase domain-containing protein n=1 Tax=Aquatica leii TaxID=1421715 RepID=A0AAN7PR55_9COLE|nr:hypothetical protein RN001_013864 [Aquatica leii]
MSKNKGRVSRSPDSLDELNKVKTKSKKLKVSLNSSLDKTKHSPGQASIISFFQTKITLHDDFTPNINETTSKAVHKKKKKTKIVVLSDESDEDLEIVTNSQVNNTKEEEMEPLVERKNAFTFMMDNRHKSIGQNSPGKEIEQLDESFEIKSEKKKKLLERKTLFQDWADQKGGKKRKIEDKERGVIIEKKLEKRSKLFKKMLKISEEGLNEKPKKMKKTITSKTKNENQKENSNCDTTKGKWQMKLKVHLSQEETVKFTVPRKEDKLAKKSNKLDNVNGDIKNDGNHQKSKNIDVDLSNVAPVFKMGNCKPKPDENAIKAKKEFLHSDLPKDVKKYIDKHQRVDLPDYIVFPTVSHVTVKPNDDQLPLLIQSSALLKLRTTDLPLPKIGCLTKGCVTKCTEPLPVEASQHLFKKIRHFKKVLKEMKKEDSDYPVYKLFKCLQGRLIPDKIVTDQTSQTSDDVNVCKNNLHQMWTDLYKPNLSEEIVGNRSAVTEIKSWLETWIECSKQIRIRRNSNSSSDFETEEDSQDKYNTLPGNTLILHGPHGCGKTMTVYAVCNELGINVLELNASTKRSGKKLLLELQEATRSHQVRKNENSLHCYLQKSNDVNKAIDKMCLLLIEDVDLVFEQDDGFVNALAQLQTTSKRPIILTTTDKNCLHLQKFSSIFPTIAFKRLPARLLSPWLRLVCLAEGFLVSKSSIESLLEINNFDMRITLLQLQFWSHTGGQLHSVQNTKTHTNINDDSKISSEDVSGFSNNLHRICTKTFQKSALLNLNLAWLNLDSKSSLKDALNVLDTLATTDVVYKKFCIEESVQPVDPTKRVITDSLELTESEETFSSCRDICCDWSKTLFDGYSAIIKRKLDKHCDRPPEKVCRITQTKNNSLLEIVPLVYHLQRDSINVDYFSTLRTINRTEMMRASNNTKRKNRFYNYLRGLGLNCSDTKFSTLSNVFSFENT